MRIGIVDLDTSHPQNWVPIERELGHEIVGVWDSATVRLPGDAEEFAKEHDIPRVFDSYEEMAPEVDCAIIHGADWDLHIEKARPFVEAGKSVLLDKPMAGCLSDLNQIKAWVAAGAAHFGRVLAAVSATMFAIGWPARSRSGAGRIPSYAAAGWMNSTMASMAMRCLAA